MLALNFLRFLKSDTCCLMCNVCYISTIGVCHHETSGRNTRGLPHLPSTHTHPVFSFFFSHQPEIQTLLVYYHTDQLSQQEILPREKVLLALKPRCHLTPGTLTGRVLLKSCLIFQIPQCLRASVSSSVK